MGLLMARFNQLRGNTMTDPEIIKLISEAKLNESQSNFFKSKTVVIWITVLGIGFTGFIKIFTDFISYM